MVSRVLGGIPLVAECGFSLLYSHNHWFAVSCASSTLSNKCGSSHSCSADPDANGDGLADDGHVALASGEDLPDLDGNGVADVLEPNGDDAQLGQIRTGFDGSAGCSISGPGRGSKDPLFALLIAGIGDALVAPSIRQHAGVGTGS